MTALSEAMVGPGGVRRVAARWVVRGELVLRTATQLGGGSGDLTDLVVIRDRFSGGPLLPGASLAGALRSHLADVLAGYGEPEPSEVARVFGGGKGDPAGDQSPLIVFDSFGTLPDNRSVEVRDGVAIDRASGTASAHAKYDLEVLPAGTRFPLRIDLVVPGESDGETEAAELQLRVLLATALRGLSFGEISLGVRRSRGLGALEGGGWAARRFPLSTADGWLEWLTADPGDPLEGHGTNAADPAEALGVRAQMDTVPDARRRLVAELELRFKQGILVRSPGEGADAPDAAHLVSAGVPVLPGTSHAGALRARAERIASHLHGDAGVAAAARLFGPEPSERRVSARSASRLRVFEAPLTDVARQRVTRVQLDRFTGGTVTSALLEEEPVAGVATVRLELRRPDPADEGLFLLVLKDVIDGLVPIGGTTSVGRGAARATARVALAGSENWIRLEPDRRPSAEELAALNERIEKFHAVLLTPNGGGG